MRDVQCGPAVLARSWMDEQKNNVDLLLLLHQQCVRPTVIKTTLMIEHKAVAVEHLAEVSSGELADIEREGEHSIEIVSPPQQREQEQAVHGVLTSSSATSTPEKKEPAPSDKRQDAVADTLRKAITPPQHNISSPRL
ncbi:hypothetical protein PTSG_02601 [Salpingoeca rosetta]|uniref:Uncharacterized protein n=1 Tax=Salpingoeca rosetta (strain ATCC 50818 / BSB-021) TaxID=946362 RepID=F2U2S1_SALR5|nr:uncharacterized protein PTSG_02601 [Salpingoeca rosetta]EGD81915.1 hypothetical protein PTSG_02601 [Salpingoeca rosetta]|eukprot:XP_004996098.1 hypothetical protein PTSG_02601 [Salpingoeca rosetta]